MTAMTKSIRFGSLLLLVFLVPAAAAAPTDDLDADGIPDAVEVQLCGRAAVRDLIDQPDVPGSCTSSTDFDASELYDAIGQVSGDAQETVEQAVADAHEAVDQANAAVHGALRLVDADEDLIPDAAETALCQVENQNDPQDGVCDGDDYSLLGGGDACDPSGLRLLCLETQPGFLQLPFGITVNVPGVISVSL